MTNFSPCVLDHAIARARIGFSARKALLSVDAFDARVVRNLISLKLGRTSEHRSLDKVLSMPEWVYSDPKGGITCL
jgi:hypothetical protein